MKQISEQLKTAIAEVLERQLAPAQVLSFDVVRDMDQDGDPILLVQVVFDADAGRLDSDRILGLPRHLREALDDLEEDSFPVFSFVKPGELEGAAA